MKPTTHFERQFFYRYDLNANIDDVEVVKDGHFGSDIVNHKGILAELYFNADPVFYKIHVSKGTLADTG